MNRKPFSLYRLFGDTELVKVGQFATEAELDRVRWSEPTTDPLTSYVFIDASDPDNLLVDLT